MRPRSVTIHGLHPFQHATLNFDDLPPNGIIAVCGPNGAGKSTFVELITGGAMYRKTATHGLIKNMARTRDAYLQERVENGATFDITHSVDSQTGSGKSLVQDEQGNPLWGDTKLETFDAWSEDHFLPREVYEAGPFAVQEAAGLCKMKPSDRMTVLLRAIGCEELEVKAKTCRDKATEASNRLTTCQARMVDEQARGGDIDAAQAGLDAATVAVLEADADAEMARGTVASLDETLAVLRSDTARLDAEVKASESAALEYEHSAAQANARREAALVAHEAARCEFQAKLLASREKATKTEQSIANSQRILADKKAIEASVVRAKELDAALSDARVRITEAGATVEKWRTAESSNRQIALTAAKAAKSAQARVDNARKRLEDRGRIEAAVVAAGEASEKLPGVVAEQEAARKALEEVRAGGMVLAEGRIVALRAVLRGIADIEVSLEDLPGFAEAGLAEDDSAVVAVKDAPAKWKAAQVRLALAESDYMTVKEEKSSNDRIAALAPTLDAAKADLDAAETEILASGSEESQSLDEAAFARERYIESARSASGIDAEIQAMTAERASLKPKLDLAEKLVVAAERLALNTQALVAAHAEIASVELNINAMPIEPPEAARAGEEAADALEGARNVRLTIESAKQTLMAASDRLSETSQTRGQARVVKDVTEVRARTARITEAAAHTRVEAAKASAAKVETLVVERHVIEDDLAGWNLLAESLGRTGLQAEEVDCAGPALTELTNDLLHTCVGSRFTATWTTTKLVDKGKREASECGITILDSEEGREAPAEQFSPGQRAPIELAASLALTMYSCNRIGIERPLLVRDESSSGLDPETSVAYVAMLRKASKQIGASHTLFISHNPAMWGLADAKIIVENGTIRIE